MIYSPWRHENAIGNGSEHCINIAKEIKRTGDQDPKIIVENVQQFYMALCIPKIEYNQIGYFPADKVNYGSPTWVGYDHPMFDKVKMPGVYPFKQTYPAGWDALQQAPDITLTFPRIYDDKNLERWKDSIVITIRERKTYWKRIDGDDCEPQRFVDPKIFHDLAMYYVNKGEKVVRLGCPQETPFPKHPNILDYAIVDNKALIDDFWFVYNSKCFISCDSGIWPMCGGFKKNMVLTNIAKKGYTEWLPKDKTRLLFKKDGKDNTMEEIIEKVKELV